MTDNLKEIGRDAYASIVAMVEALECDYDKPMHERDDAEQRIHEDALSVEVRSGWASPGDTLTAGEFRILITTGGPAVRICGELNEYCEPIRAWLEIQDWGTPWTQYPDASQETLLTYARCFYYGE
jgi:hypothetical protein